MNTHILMLLPCLFWVALGYAATPLPSVDPSVGLYEVAVEPGVSLDDVRTSLKVVSEGMNFVNPANFPIGEHMQQRGQSPQGALEIKALCNLSMGTEIFLDHPEFSVYAPCRIAIYQKSGHLYLGLARPTFDLQSIKNPTSRARAAAQELEKNLIEIMDKARKGDF